MLASQRKLEISISRIKRVAYFLHYLTRRHIKEERNIMNFFSKHFNEAYMHKEVVTKV